MGDVDSTIVRFAEVEAASLDDRSWPVRVLSTARGIGPSVPDFVISDDEIPLAAEDRAKRWNSPKADGGIRVRSWGKDR